MNKGNKSSIVNYVLGTILGLGAGAIDVWLGDLLVTAVFVMLSTMLLGLLRPERAWRWTVLVAVCVPLVQILAHSFLKEHISLSHVQLSFSGFLTGTVGAYAGAFARMGIDLLVLPEKHEPAAKADVTK
ncbi:MAG TPA: hypothetical protein VGG46_07375 [Terriglobales bacterium]|jgi:hypothetical protein